MSAPVIASEAVIGALVGFVVVVLAFIYIRRHAIAGGKPLMLCALRTEGSSRWRLGLLRFGQSQMDWFTLIGPSVRPTSSWERPRLDLSSPRPARESIPGIVDPIAVTGRCGGRSFELALSPPAYTAMRSWLESLPPGFNVNVA